MSQPELKLVWINGTALGSRSQKRRQRAQMAEQPVPNKTGVESTKGWQSYFDRKQAVTYLIVAIIGSVLTLIGQATIGLWSTISENQESRLIEKIRKDEPPASNIKTKVIESSELASLKTEVTDARKDIGIIKQSIARIEGREQKPTLRIDQRFK